MLETKTHVVTLRVLPVETHKDYMIKHAEDCNAWQAWFELSQLDQWNKLEQCFKLLPQTIVVDIACVFAESVLAVFENECPQDTRPRDAIAAARAWIADPSQENRDAARAVAGAADAAANAADAAYAANAAARAADAASYAAYAATDAAADAAANAADAAYAANAAARAAYVVDMSTYAAGAAVNAADAAAINAAYYASYDVARKQCEADQIKIILTMIRSKQDEIKVNLRSKHEQCHTSNTL